MWIRMESQIACDSRELCTFDDSALSCIVLKAKNPSQKDIWTLRIQANSD